MTTGARFRGYTRQVTRKGECMSLLESLSPVQIVLAVLMGYVLPAALLCWQTKYLLHCWKYRSRGELPLLAAYHFASGDRNCRPCPTRADALPRYLASWIPVLNLTLVLATLFLLVFLAIPEAIFRSHPVSNWLRRPL